MDTSYDWTMFNFEETDELFFKVLVLGVVWQSSD